MPPKSRPSSTAAAARGNANRPTGGTATNAAANRSWLPGERFSAKQVGLLIFVVCLATAAIFDVVRFNNKHPAAESDAMLQALYALGETLPKPSATYTSVAELQRVAAAAREAADVIDEFDADALPQVASAAAVVTTDVAARFGPAIEQEWRDVAMLEEASRLCMAAADVALHANADEPHVALLVTAAAIMRRWANLTTPPEVNHPRHDSAAHQMLLRRAGMLEQAIALQSARPGLRVMYAVALIELQRYDDAKPQIERVLRNHPTYEHRRWVEWLDTLALEHTADGEYDAAKEMREFAEAARASHAVVPQESFLGGTLKFPLIDDDVLVQLTPA